MSEPRKMKCDTCDNMLHHFPGSFMSVAEGGDDPYDYDYCAKFHWGGSGEPEDCASDPWADCKDYVEKKKNEHS